MRPSRDRYNSESIDIKMIRDGQYFSCIILISQFGIKAGLSEPVSFNRNDANPKLFSRGSSELCQLECFGLVPCPPIKTTARSSRLPSSMKKAHARCLAEYELLLQLDQTYSAVEVLSDL